ncbi:hypothetical protein [Streptomyces sp. S1]|uniref:hypothetical protein n=1 Tax=Streptomyces sp. S1 TaxID=718288 RepID=UPI001969BC51|nr:hypothetical protein [Streptomyces sp. S1]
MDSRSTGRATVRRAFGPTIGASVVHARSTGRATVRGTLGPTVGTTVVHTGRTGRAAVRGALLLVRVLLRVSHVSS